MDEGVAFIMADMLRTAVSDVICRSSIYKWCSGPEVRRVLTVITIFSLTVYTLITLLHYGFRYS